MPVGKGDSRSVRRYCSTADEHDREAKTSRRTTQVIAATATAPKSAPPIVELSSCRGRERGWNTEILALH